jgi:hypothetical protein
MPMKIRSSVILITLAFVFLVSLSKSQAVVPPPDGGYAGGNTAEGHLALASLNTSAGLYNTAAGVYSLLSITDGSFCTGVGAGTLLANTANENTATGAGALLSNTPARTIRRMERLRSFSTPQATSTPPPVTARSLTMQPALKIQLSALARCLATPAGAQTRLSGSMRF